MPVALKILLSVVGAVLFCFAPVIVQPTAAAQSRSTRIRTGIAVFGCFVMEMMRVLSCPPRPDIVVAALRGSTRSRHVMRMSERP